MYKVMQQGKIRVDTDFTFFAKEIFIASNDT